MENARENPVRIPVPGREAACIGLCFLLTSTGYLAWVYHLLDLVPPAVSDGLSMVGAYAMQAVGIGAFSVLVRRRNAFAGRAFLTALALHLLCLLPALHAASLVWTLVFGYAMNVFCGMIAGYYLWRLAGGVQPECCARTLGAGYSVSILGSWLLSLAGGRNVYKGDLVPAVCLALSAAAAAMAFLSPLEHVFSARRTARGTLPPAWIPAMTLTDKRRIREAASETAAKTRLETAAKIDPETAAKTKPGTVAKTSPEAVPASRLTGVPGEKGLHILPSVCALVLLFSIINSCGFAFPAADLGRGISLEFSRLFYAAGLLIAGFVNDRNRRHGAVWALAALVFPFIMLSLQGEAASVRFFWAASYFTFGFYTVYRIILLVDIARGTQRPELSGCGLLVGRIGDAAGEAVCLAFSSNPWLLAGIPAALFIVTVFVFLRLYPVFYASVALVPAYAGSVSGPGGTGEASGSSRVSAFARTGQDTSLHVEHARDDRDYFHRFCGKYELSAREREVLRLLLNERSNVEIADELSISAGTVKYHIHNLLQKTGCRNRLVLLTLYYSEKE